MHTFFTLEDVYGLHIDEIDGELCLRLDRHNKQYTTMFELFHAWNEQYQKQKSDEQFKDQYDEWRYHYPEKDHTRLKVQVPHVLDDLDLKALK